MNLLVVPSGSSTCSENNVTTLWFIREITREPSVFHILLDVYSFFLSSLFSQLEFYT